MIVLSVSYLAAVEAEVYPQHDNYWTGRVRAMSNGYAKFNAEMFIRYHPSDTSWQSWVKFDLSTIPPGMAIDAAEVRYNVVSASEPGPLSKVRVLANDPVLNGAQSLWQEVSTGPVASAEVENVVGWMNVSLDSVGLAAIAAGVEQGWVALGLNKSDLDDTRAVINGYGNAPYRPRLWVSYSEPPVVDFAVDGVSGVPDRVLLDTELQPGVVVGNPGDVDQPFRVWLKFVSPDVPVYVEYLDIDGLVPGESLVVPFPSFVVERWEGDWAAEAWVEAAGDAQPNNDRLVHWFETYGPDQPLPSPVTWGWEEVAIMPLGPRDKQVKQGGWLAFDEPSGMIVGAKGNKTGEVYGYDPLRNRWHELSDLPFDKSSGARGKAPGKEARAIDDGKGGIYVLHGRRSLAFWRYVVSEDRWEELAPVLPGELNKPVRAGADLAYVELNGKEYIYLLKGGGVEFHRYDIGANAWEALARAPVGSRGKWAGGSWLVYDGERYIYAHKSRYYDKGLANPAHELWRYDVLTGAWSDARLAGMPLLGSHLGRLRYKKSKDGSAADLFEGAIYALKGGNTQQFWKYVPEQDAWFELESMPAIGSTQRRKLVKLGGDFVSYARGRAFYALKGNKVREFWRYRMPPEGWQQGGGQAEVAGLQPRLRISLAPNPAVDRALVSFESGAGSGELNVRDVAGRLVLRRSIGPARSGRVLLDLSGLQPGSYFVQYVSGAGEASAKLVVGRR